MDCKIVSSYCPHMKRLWRLFSTVDLCVSLTRYLVVQRNLLEPDTIQIAFLFFDFFVTKSISNGNIMPYPTRGIRPKFFKRLHRCKTKTDNHMNTQHERYKVHHEKRDHYHLHGRKDAFLCKQNRCHGCVRSQLDGQCSKPFPRLPRPYGLLEICLITVATYKKASKKWYVST